ncbi:MAG TPA: histidine kinase, partial [Candidatus Marinimicrobia bacterium]|nr:histidine kinase [Candidatus Neomarinimicrobiota bacterium]
FPEDRKGRISVQLLRQDKKISLVLANNGIGLPEDFSLERTGGFGLQLVSMLVKQLDGTLNIHSNDETQFEIIFPYS